MSTDSSPSDSHDVLAITLLHGPANGRQVVFRQGPILFGRDTDNAIPIQADYASRQHGRFRTEKGVWWLQVLSPNGCQVNGKTLDEKKSRKIAGGEVVSLANQPLFRVDLLPSGNIGATDGATSADASTPSAATKPSFSKKTRWLVILGIWWLALLGLFVFMSMNNQTATGPTAIAAPELTAKEIADAIIKPRPKQPPDEAQAARLIRQANDLSATAQATSMNLFRTYDQYQAALSYLPGETFPDPLDDLRYKDIQSKLIDEVVKRYRRAYSRLGNNRFADAAADFTSLMGFYHDPQSIIYRNALDQAKAANSRIPQKKR